jgi:alpha-galactosidase
VPTDKVDHEVQDADLFASWGVDYLKYDNCGGGEPEDSLTRMTHMRNALVSQSRPILFALCQGGVENVYKWGNRTGHSWRISDDIFPAWDRIMWIASIQAKIWDYSGPFGFNDLDMLGNTANFLSFSRLMSLEVGNGRLTLEEQRTHFNLWALSKSPLLTGTHVSSLNELPF